MHFMRLTCVGLMLISLLAVMKSAHANPTVFNAWMQIYPEYDVSVKNCQVCHQSALGGDGWNSYGFDVRLFVLTFGYEDFESAFRAAESHNSDNDSQELTNREEIDLGLDPGWAPGRSNTIWFKDGTTLLNQLPPFPESEEGICFPIVVAGGSATLICL